MQLNLQTFFQILEQQATAVQSATTQVTNFAAGSVVRAILEATASVSLWLQAMFAQVLSATRLATSSGADVDTFLADFDLFRSPAVAASGNCTFSRNSTTLSATLYLGVQVATTDGTQQFVVVEDQTNAAWNNAQNAYVVGSGVASVTVPVQAVTAGSAGNVLANTISLIQTACQFSSVYNSAAFVNGVDPESDAACKAQFAAYVQTRSLSTVQAIQYAVQAIQAGVTAYVAENVSTTGAYQPGNVVITVDNGTGYPPTSLITQAYAAANVTRGAGITIAVQPPSVVAATVVLTITVGAGYRKTSLQPLVQSAMTAYINDLPVGSPMPFSQIATQAYLVSPGIINVTAITLNGGTADIGGGPSQVCRVATVTVN